MGIFSLLIFGGMRIAEDLCPYDLVSILFVTV